MLYSNNGIPSKLILHILYNILRGNCLTYLQDLLNKISTLYKLFVMPPFENV